MQKEIQSNKKYSTAVILSGIFGVMGIHHFYVGRIGMGFLDLGLFLATIFFFILNYEVLAVVFFLADLVHTVLVTYLLLVGQYRDGSGHLITYPNQKL